ncbi:arginine--tRNA ligase [Candidatus Woesebacteria bacterium RIFCSPLOWO2_01_FULL_39_10b]|uniref:Arginine--tRNA ligase n=1 Tax=Candidatus Woesebacteria bacterium RIFCSPLOWO2_01_FULL_39_10b TaxID=1802517 RepID=A0A1F8B8U7_9BACT|nr:MAG: arginine--tRNA ligase [Candidatus Woesebacteria bacterium RIFCSPLOWO2_01_FULL_39_10b]
MVKDEIAQVIQRATGEENIHLQIPEIDEYGDYSTNLALQLFSKPQKGKVSKFKNPRELAEEIVKKLSKDKKLLKIVSKIEVAGPGFINFWLATFVLITELKEVFSKGDDYGKSDILKGKRIMVEYGQPNTHKLPHIGHLFSYIYGESLVRLLQASGAQVFRANYQGDVGPHVAKCLWALLKEKSDVPADLSEKTDLLQKMYQLGSNAYEKDPKAKIEIDQLNVRIYSEDKSLLDVWRKTRKWSLDYYKGFEKRLGIKYDRAFFESEVHKKGKRVIEENIGTIFKQSRGAVIFEGGKYGLHDRVFLTRLATPTYEAKDIYLQKLKMKMWPFDLQIITTANEQNEYFKVIFKALELLDPIFEGKLKHIGFGMVQLKSGKISSRKGRIIGAVELIDVTIDEIKKIVVQRADLDGREKERVAEVVGVGAVKYSFLKTNPLKDIKFEFQESISREGNSGPYLQYTYARTRSVLRKFENSVSSTSKIQNFNVKHLNSEEMSLLRSFPRFSDVVSDAQDNYSPNILCNYLYDLAQKFNTFYNAHRILDDKSKKEDEFKKRRDFRLALTVSTGQILKNGLNLLGIQAPEKM